MIPRGWIWTSFEVLELFPPYQQVGICGFEQHIATTTGEQQNQVWFKQSGIRITDFLPNAVVGSNFRVSNTLAYNQIPARLLTFWSASAVSFMQLVNVNMVKGQTNWVKMINIAEQITVASLTSLTTVTLPTRVTFRKADGSWFVAIFSQNYRVERYILKYGGPITSRFFPHTRQAFSSLRSSARRDDVVICGPGQILLCLHWLFSLSLSLCCSLVTSLPFTCVIFQEDTSVQVCCNYLMMYLRRIEWKPHSLWSHCPAHTERRSFFPSLSPCCICSPTCFSVLGFCFVHLFVGEFGDHRQSSF